jgi:multidrug efflux pump subunit AcrA (membrane-fusion protein)
MAKNTRQGNQERNRRYREALAARGIRPVQVMAPETAHSLIRQAAGLMTRDDDPLEPRAALRLAGGSNESDEADASPELRAELEAARARIEQIEREAEARRLEIETEAERQRRTLEAERDAARAAEVVEREKAESAMAEARTASERAVEAEGQASVRLRRAKLAEGIVKKVQDMPGARGWLVRWLAGDVLEQQGDGDRAG